MASIKVSELSSTGSDLFNDSESFLDELADSDILTGVEGGLIGFCFENLFALYSGETFINRMYANENPLTIAGGKGNSVNNNGINGQSVNAYSLGNHNTIAV